MKRMTYVLLSLVMLMGMGISAHAQDLDKLVINVPFRFLVNGTKLPAGAYVFGRNSPTDPVTMTIQSTDGRYSSYLIGNVEGSVYSRPADPRLVFDVVDGEHYLRAVGTSFGVHTLVPPQAQADASHRTRISAASSAAGQ